MRFILIYIVVFLCATSCKGHLNKNNALEFDNSFSKKLDTLSVLILEGKRYDNSIYKIAHLANVENGQEQLQVLQNNRAVSSIFFPIADEEVKNFSLSKIERTKKGFNMSIQWGGGNYFYQKLFVFSFIKGTFYLVSLKTSKSIQTPASMKNTKQTISPPIEMSKVKVIDYLNM